MGWVVAKAKTKKQGDTDGRTRMAIHDAHMYAQWTNNPLQDLDRCVLMVKAISGPYCQFRTHYWHHFTSCAFT